MHLTWQQKISFGVLGLAVSAFLVDRVVLQHEPAQTAAAESLVVPAETRTTGVSGGTRPISPAASTVPFSTRLHQLASRKGVDSSRSADAFVLPMSWAMAGNSDPRHDIATPGSDFAATHALTGLMTSNAVGVAVINGRPVSVGQEIDGWRLVAVDRRSATLVTSKAQVALTLSTPPHP